jgi:hypothetical protein
MDHEVVPRPCMICDWLLNSSQDHFGLHQGKNVRVTMESKVLNRHILRPTLSTDMIQRVLRWEKQKRCSRRKRQGPMVRKSCYNKILLNFFRGREDEDKRKQRMVKLEFFSKLLFLEIFKKKSTHSQFGAGSFLHIQFTPTEGPEDFVYQFLINRTMEGEPWKSNRGKRPSSIVQLHGPWCKLALRSKDPHTFNNKIKRGKSNRMFLLGSDHTQTMGIM